MVTVAPLSSALESIVVVVAAGVLEVPRLRVVVLVAVAIAPPEVTLEVALAVASLRDSTSRVPLAWTVAEFPISTVEEWEMVVVTIALATLTNPPLALFPAAEAFVEVVERMVMFPVALRTAFPATKRVLDGFRFTVEFETPTEIAPPPFPVETAAT